MEPLWFRRSHYSPWSKRKRSAVTRCSVTWGSGCRMRRRPQGRRPSNVAIKSSFMQSVTDARCRLYRRCGTPLSESATIVANSRSHCGRTCSHEEGSASFRFFAESRRSRFRSGNRRRTAVAMVSSSSSGTSRFVSLSVRISGMPSTLVATTGRPIAQASMMLTGILSTRCSRRISVHPQACVRADGRPPAVLCPGPQ